MVRSALDRRAVVAKLLENRGNALVVTGLGSPSYDVHASGDDDRNYYLWGAMGGAALVGLGLAQAQPEERVLVITGDGEQLMAFGSLATISVAKPNNLDIIVLDNQHYGETGMQTSHTGQGIDLSAVAQACGFTDTDVYQTMDEIDEMIDRMSLPTVGPRLFVIKISSESIERSLPPRDATFIKNRFRAALGFSTC